jgi:hypothetical protein
MIVDLVGRYGEDSDRVTCIAEKLSLINLANNAYGISKHNY